MIGRCRKRVYAGARTYRCVRLASHDGNCTPEDSLPAPRRALLAEALGVATHRGAAWWRAQAGRAVHGISFGAGFIGETCRWVQWKTDDPQEAWEAAAAAGLIGHGDVGSDLRAFECPGDHPDDGKCTAAVPCGGYGVIAQPATVADCVVFASDWPNVLAAEAMARALRDSPAMRLVWRVGGVGSARFTGDGKREQNAALEALGYRLGGDLYHAFEDGGRVSSAVLVAPPF